MGGSDRPFGCKVAPDPHHHQQLVVHRPTSPLWPFDCLLQLLKVFCGKCWSRPKLPLTLSCPTIITTNVNFVPVVVVLSVSSLFLFSKAADDSDTGIGVCGWILTILCWLLVLVTMPFSFFICFKVSRPLEALPTSNYKVNFPPAIESALNTLYKEREILSPDGFSSSFLHIDPAQCFMLMQSLSIVKCLFNFFPFSFFVC